MSDPARGGRSARPLPAHSAAWGFSFPWRVSVRSPSTLVRLAAWSVVEAVPAFLLGHAVARAIEDGFAAGRPLTGAAWLAVLGGAWLVAAVGARQVMLAIAAIAEPFRDDLLTAVAGGGLARAVASFRPGDSAAVARSTLQVELARDAFAAVITVVRSFVFTMAGVVLGMSTLVPELLWPVLGPLAAGVALFLLSLPAMARRQRAFLLADERLTEAVTDMAGGLRDITACGAEDRVAADVGRLIDEQARAARAVARVTAVRTLSLGVGTWLPVAGVLALAPRMDVSAGVVVGTLAYVVQSLAPALGGLVEGLGVSGVRLAVSLARIAETSALPGGAVPPGSAPSRRSAGFVPSRLGDASAPGGRMDIQIRGVTFGYGMRAEPVIAELDLDVPDGDHLAVVGPSGMGKSTLAALLAGLLEPCAGEIRLGGVPAGDLDPAERVLIPQEAYVFRGTLEENLRYLAGDAPRAAVEAAVEAMGMADLVRRLGGYEAVIDPAALSAGQRQLIALTRAHLAPARLVVLDEATCHLDPAAEARAETAFARRGGTLIVVAHRLTSALRARRVLLMDGARVRLGTHDELVSTSPLYADLAGQWNPDLERVP